jgi:hypothetical protein
LGGKIKDEMGGTCSMPGEMRNVYKSLVRNLKGKRPFVRPRYRWKDKIKMDLKDTGCEGEDWIKVIQDRVR